MYCLCGCSQITNIAKRQGRAKKGQHYRYIAGHQNRGNNHVSKGIAQLVTINQGKHLCGCGCGNFIKVATHHFYSGRGIPKYIHGHYIRTPEMIIKTIKRNKQRIGELSPRWKKDRNDIRGRKRCKVDFTKRQKKDIYIRDKGICRICNVFCLRDVLNEHPFKANIDHILPIKDGGSNDISNGQILCLSCHKFKHSAIANRMNSRKPKRKDVGNLEPSSQSEKVQRLLESSDTLNNQNSVRLEREEIVQY